MSRRDATVSEDHALMMTLMTIDNDDVMRLK